MGRNGAFGVTTMVVALTGALWAATARANTLTVTSTADNTTGPGCTLRMAVAAANTGASNACGQGTGNKDVIQIGISGSVTIALNPSLGPLQVTSSMTIQGNFNGQAPNYTTVTISTTSGSIITIPSSSTANTLVLQWLHFTGGNAGTGNGGCMAFNGGSLVDLNVVQIDHCSAGSGGAIYSNANAVNIYWSYIHDNTATFGGAVNVPPSAKSVIATSSTFYNNHATASGGAIYGNNARVELFETTLNGNSATTDGGGVYTTAADGVNMTNATIANNVATNGHGGGIYLQEAAGGYWEVSNITVAHNSAGSAGGGLYIASTIGGTVEDGNNIFAYNTAPQGPDVFGNAQFFASGPDIITNASGNTPPMGGGYGPWIVTDPQLGTLQSIGGLPAVYPLLPNSPAIEAGTGTAGGFDERGMCRAQLNSTPDIGAFEYSPLSTYVITSVNSGLVLDDPGSSKTAGTQMEQWSLNNGLNQQWQMLWDPAPGSPVSLVNQASSLMLGIRGASTTAGAAVEQETYQFEGTSSQAWTLSPAGVGTGYFTFTNVNSHLLMDVVGASKTAGALIDQWTSNNNANQKWTFTVNPTTPLCPQYVSDTAFSNPN